jgi:hypothetical protein
MPCVSDFRETFIAIEAAEQLRPYHVVTVRHAQLEAGLHFVRGAHQHATTTRCSHLEQRRDRVTRARNSCEPTMTTDRELFGVAGLLVLCLGSDEGIVGI